MRAELARYGMSIRDYPPVRSARWLTAGELRLGAPVPWHELAALEAALARVRDDAERVAAGDQALAALSAADYVERLHPSDALRDFLLGWWQLMGGASPQHGAASDALDAIHEHGGLTGLLTCLAHGPLPGWSALAEAMAHDVVDLRLGTAVTTIEHGDAGVICTTERGEVHEAEALVLAVPLNCLPGIAFEPALPPGVAEAAGANAGRAVKVLMLVRGVDPNGIAVGIGPGLNWLYADTAEDGCVLVTGFGWQDDRFDPAARGHVERALRAFHPDAELVDWAQHDWIADPASRGTWLTAPAGRIDLVSPDRFDPVGRIAFAGSDMARQHAGWFEGALVSGAAAAAHVLR